MSIRKKLRIIIFIVVLLFGVVTGLWIFKQSENSSSSTDYSLCDNWLAIPHSSEYDVDVFYLYPTAYSCLDSDDSVVCNIDNKLMRTNSQIAYKRQATAFSTVGNIYAPYYRQADAIYALSLSNKDKDELLSGVIKDDVIAAFDYYINNFSNGRPFILAGHSQGSNMLLYILSEYMKNHPDIYKRMIAAYVIGYSVTEDYLAKNSHLKFAKGPNDTGVIISYNTQATLIEGENPVVLEGALVINPITWTRDEETALAKENLGSLMLNEDGSLVLDENNEFIGIKNFADATVSIEKNALICSTVDVDIWGHVIPFLPKGVFHSFDYPFYYYNIRKNASDRVKEFFYNQ